MRSVKPRLLVRPATAAADRLPWLPSPPTRRSPPLSPPLTNAAILRAITSPTATPNHLLSLYSRAALQPNFRHDYPTYAALIPLLAHRRLLRAAALLLSRMPRDNLRPGPALLLPLLSAPLPDSALTPLLLSCSLTDHTFSTILPALLCNNRLSTAFSLVTNPNLPFPIKVRHYIGIVRAYCAYKPVAKAIQLLDIMADKGSVPDVRCYGTIIRGLPVEAGFKMVEQMRRAGRDPDVVVWNMLVHGCVREGEVRRAEEVVAEMVRRGVSPDTGTYNVLIAGYRSVGDAVKMFELMVERGVSPDVITFSTLMGRLRKVGREAECDGLFGKMMKMGVSPDDVCYRVMDSGCRKNSVPGD